MRQADSAIKGYIYQFNKSLEEILCASDDDSITLEGCIEDIDITTFEGITTIQCKYHEDQSYQMSRVAVPILEMLCHFSTCTALGKCPKYILYAYFKDNTASPALSDFKSFISTTTNKEIWAKFFHQIYEISEPDILVIANKERKTHPERGILYKYYESNQSTLKLKVDIDQFWEQFTYIQAEKYDVLKKRVIDLLSEIVDQDTAHNLYYPNAFSLVADLSSKHNVAERIITKKQLLNQLSEEKSVLLTRWVIEITEKKSILRQKKLYLSSLFHPNSEVRAFVFTDEFLDQSNSELIPFIRRYIEKYYKKPTLQKPPIFIFGDNHDNKIKDIIISLHNYQQSVNSGVVAGVFMEDSFVNNTDCAANFKCKITSLRNIDDRLLERCQVDQLFWVGKMPILFNSEQFTKELLDIQDLHTLKYLVGLETTLEGT